MEFDEITISSPDFPGGQTFGPVTLEHTWEGPVDLNGELPVTMTRRARRFLGVPWCPEVYRTRGVFTVTGNRIMLRPTASVVIECRRSPKSAHAAGCDMFLADITATRRTDGGLYSNQDRRTLPDGLLRDPPRRTWTRSRRCAT